MHVYFDQLPVPGGAVKFHMFVKFVQLSVPNRMHSSQFDGT